MRGGRGRVRVGCCPGVGRVIGRSGASIKRRMAGNGRTGARRPKVVDRTVSSPMNSRTITITMPMYSALVEPR